MISCFKFKALLQKKTWLSPAYVGVDNMGRITYLSEVAPAQTTAVDVVNGYALPGFQNAHSHAFQYAMAGIAEDYSLQNYNNDFWTWREAMYRCALTVDPDQAEAIATMLYTEMVRHGYTHVAEFHYLHHDKTGKPYNNLAEMGTRMIAAAKKANIKITLIPIFYQQGDFGQPPKPEQRRFISKTIDDYFNLLEASSEAIKFYANANLGLGIHSLRAVELDAIVATCHQAPASLPFHIHVAEQQKEIENCLTYSGKRPLHWILDNIPLNDNFHLVHATHLDDSELLLLAQSKAHVVLCPSTEGNLGDGVFNAKKYVQQGGNWSIGTDSHIGINPLAELRMIDYNQRMLTHMRTTFDSTSFYMIGESIASGRRAMGHSSEENFEIGKPLDVAVFDARSPLLSATSLKNMAATIVFTADLNCLYGTLLNGKWIVRNTGYSGQEKIKQNFVEAIHQINNR